MAKSRPLSKNMWYEWYDSHISHIPKPMKKSVSSTKTTNQKRMQAPSMKSRLNTKVKAMNNYQSRNTLKELDHINVI